MEIVVVIIMLLVGFNFVLKLTYHGAAGRFVLCLLPALFMGMTYDYATLQSKTQLADWLSRPELMLDMSVLLTVDVVFQLCFCFLMALRLVGHTSRKQSWMLRVALWFPGLLVFPTFFSLLVEVIFAMPGVDFVLIGWGTAGVVLCLLPLLAYGLRWVLPENDIRLELMFYINLLTAALGVVATVNGRTAAVGTDTVEYCALAAIILLLLLGTVAGLFVNNYITSKKISNLK